MSEYLLNFDGSCWPNPGPNAGYGFVVKRNGNVFHTESGALTGQTFTNNYAEFHAVGKGLEFIATVIEKNDKLFIRGDSQLVINILNGRWKGRNGTYAPACEFAKKALTSIRALKIPTSIDWVPRDYNKEADKLSTVYLEW